MIAAIQEDYREIGVMKAIGLHKKQIRNTYLAKYGFLGLISCLTGLCASPIVKNIFSRRITTFVGKSGFSFLTFLIPALAVCAMFVLFIAFCGAVLRRTEKITPIKALVTGDAAKKSKIAETLRLGRGFGRLNFFLGFRDIVIRGKTYLTLLIIFILGVFILLTPINLYTTIDSPNFITYMGIGRSDIRVDISSAQNSSALFAQVVSRVMQDSAVGAYQMLTTYRYETTDSDGLAAYINIEVGEHEIFPISCTEGRLPQSGEIALSNLNSEALGVSVGDTVVAVGEQGGEELTVSGIYQDITNGGKTAKAKNISISGTRLWSVINLQLKSGSDAQRVLEDYRAEFPGIKANRLNDYKSQNLDAFMSAMFSASLLGIVLAVVVLTIITTLFAYMLIALDKQDIAIMRAVGFSFKDIQKQYVARILSTLFFGIAFGAILSSTLGSGIVNTLGGTIGVSRIRFEVNPLMAYFMFPALLFLFIGSVCVLICRGAGNFNIAEKLKK
jgi:putative ABC transport system permease protein